MDISRCWSGSVGRWVNYSIANVQEYFKMDKTEDKMVTAG